MVFRCDSLSRHSNKQPPSCELLRLEIRSRCFFQIEHSSVFIGHRLGVWLAEIYLNSSVFYCFHKVLTCFLSFYNANQKRVHTCMVMVQVPSTWFVGKSKWSKWLLRADCNVTSIYCIYFGIYSASILHKLKYEQVWQKCLNQRRQGIQNQNRDQGSVKSFSCGRDC